MPSHERTTTDRRSWRARRVEMEARGEKHTPFGSRRRHWGTFEHLLIVFRLLLKATRLFDAGARRALDPDLVEHEIRHPQVPPEFDGYRLLHLTDLHLDGSPRLDEIIAALVRDRPVDLALWTGDYRWGVRGEYRQVLPGLARIARSITASDGQFATLGNHDPGAMAEALEELDLRVLTNETGTIRRGAASLHVTGLDDVHYFYTDAAAFALAQPLDGFKIALVHSPEAAHLAAQAGYGLYLCGHTHGGQVCLPGGWPIITHSALKWRHAKGFWQRGGMLGYTSSGAGTSGVPVRFFSRGEVTVFTLRRAQS